MVTKYYNFTLIDGNGTAPQPNAELYIENGKIVNPCDAEKEVNLEGKWVIPGLMDGHVHYTMPIPDVEHGKTDTSDVTKIGKTIWAIKNFEEAIKQGITTVRDVGSFDLDPIEIELRQHLKSGWLKGPQYFCSGNLITMTGGHAADSGLVADGVEEVKKATRSLIGKGVDLIKTVASGGVATEGNDPNAYQYNVDELTAIVTEAHKVNKKVAVHVHATQGIKNAIIAGADTIEHGTLADDECIQMMLDGGKWLIPTFTIKHLFLTDPRIPAFLRDKEKALEEAHNISFKKAYDAGVKIACGTDMTPTLVPFTVQTEIALMMEQTGMSVLEGIQIATKNTAEMIGVEKTHGTLELGKVADFVVLNSSPIENVENLKDISAVYQRGTLVD